MTTTDSNKSDPEALREAIKVIKETRALGLGRKMNIQLDQAISHFEEELGEALAISSKAKP